MQCHGTLFHRFQTLQTRHVRNAFSRLCAEYTVSTIIFNEGSYQNYSVPDMKLYEQSGIKQTLSVTSTDYTDGTIPSSANVNVREKMAMLALGAASHHKMRQPRCACAPPTHRRSCSRLTCRLV